MNQQPSDERAAADRREASRIRRAGQTCITLFVVFLTSVLSFGKAPVIKVTHARGFRLDLNLISCLGVAVGVFALIYLLVSFKRILRLPTTKKVLGLIGGFGLVAHTILALFLPLSYGGVAAPAVGTAGNQPFGQRGPEEWVIDGKTYRISSTYYLRSPKGFQFTVEYPHRFVAADRDMDDERALEIAFPLMKHAYGSNLYKRTSVTKFGEGKLVPSRIGVVLFEGQGKDTRGYRVALSLDQIRERMERDVPSGSTAPSDPSGASQ